MPLKPKIITTLKDYSLDQFIADSVAGLIVGIVALPLAIAFAIASGVSPERGLFTAIIGGFIASLLGGSRVQISGPTGAFVVIVYGIVTQFGMDGLLLATFLGGVLLLIMGLARLGSAIKFIPYPVVIGFTSGIAVIIFSSQVKDFLGLKTGPVPASFLAKWSLFLEHLNTINPYAFILSISCVIIILAWRKITQRIPGPLVVVILSTVLVYYWHLPVETIGSRFGEIPHVLPQPAIPKFSIELIHQILPSSLTIALLAGIESLLSAVVADGMIGGKHRSNMELVAQGIANIVSPLFGGIPVTGAIARTATNINNGGRTPVAGIIHSIVLLIIMFFMGHLVAYIPLASLAAILIVVAYNMSEWHSFGMVLKTSSSDAAVLLVTFGLTVLIDLTVAIQVGVVLSCFLFMRRMALDSVEVIRHEFTDEDETVNDPMGIDKKDIPPGVEVYEVNGPFFFGAAYKFMEAMTDIGKKKPKVRIIRMRNVPIIDTTGLHVLRQQYQNSRKHGIFFVISGINAEPYTALEKAGLLDLLGKENVVTDIDLALSRARQILQQQKLK